MCYSIGVCHPCMKVYKELWLELIFDCKDKFKSVVDTTLPSDRDLKVKLYSEILINLFKNYQIIPNQGHEGNEGHDIKIKPSIKKILTCQRGFSFKEISNGGGCDLNTNRCSCCMSIKMLCVIKLMTTFRLSQTDMYLKDIYFYNCEICDKIIKFISDGPLDDNVQSETQEKERTICASPYQDQGQDLQSISTNEDTDERNDSGIELIVPCSPEPINRNCNKILSFPNTWKENLRFKFLGMFEQFHKDDLNLCKYMDHIFESSSYLFKKGILFSNNENSVELVCIETNVSVKRCSLDSDFSNIHVGNLDNSKNIKAENYYVTNSHEGKYPNHTQARMLWNNISGCENGQVKNLVGPIGPIGPIGSSSSKSSTSQSNNRKELFQKTGDFVAFLIQMLFNHIPFNTLNSYKFCPYDVFNLIIQRYFSIEKKETAKGRPEENDRTLKSKHLWNIIENFKSLRQRLVILTFLWSFDHRYGRFYMNEH